MSANLYKIHKRVRVKCRLPLHMVDAQIAAHRAKFPAVSLVANTLVYDSFDFVWCPVCNGVNSMLREFGGDPRKTYKYGLRNVSVDYETDFIYCRNDKRTHLGHCGDIPLQRFPLFGLVVEHNDRYIMLCTECGSPMVINLSDTYAL